MPRRSALSQISPNRFYEIDATLKYQHVSDNVITGIIQQGDVQNKISIPKDGIELEEGKQYNFGKCFNSRNGWLYAKNPSQTVTLKGSSNSNQSYYSIKELFEKRHQLTNHYVDAVLKVVSIEPKQEVVKNDETLTLYNLKCYEDDRLINVEVWNYQIKPQEVNNKILKFVGFKLKMISHYTVHLVSTVYSKLQKLNRLPYNRQKFIYNPNAIYKNVSSAFDIRTIEELQNACQEIHKNYSICEAIINFSEQLQYEGCNKCKKKIEENKCLQCGSRITKEKYKYLKVVLQDDTSMMECAVFDQNSIQQIKSLGLNSKAYFFVKSSAKKNHQTGEFFTSHVITQVKKK